METDEANDIGQQQSQQTQRKQKQQRERLEKTISALFDISKAVSHTHSLEEFYRVIHRILAGLIRMDNFFIALHDPALDSITFPYYVGKNDPSPLEPGYFNESLALTDEVIAAGRPMIFFQADILALARQNGQRVAAPLSRVWAGVPLIVKQQVVGVMAVPEVDRTGSGNSHDPGLDLDLDLDLDLLNAVAGHVALALERKLAQTQIGEQQNILEKILESSPVGIALVENRVFKWVNEEMVRMFGYPSKQDFENRSVKKIYRSESDFERAGKIIFETLSSQGTADYEMDLVKQDGSLFSVHIRLNSPGQESPMSWTIASFTDISHRRVAEQENFERERLQGVLEMAGAVCHEINQPLQAIIGYSELMLMDPESPVSKSSFDSIKSQVDRLGKITDTLSNITRYTTVDYPGNTRIVNIWEAGSPEQK